MNPNMHSKAFNHSPGNPREGPRMITNLLPGHFRFLVQYEKDIPGVRAYYNVVNLKPEQTAEPLVHVLGNQMQRDYVP
jgi:hypothetical protein